MKKWIWRPSAGKCIFCVLLALVLSILTGSDGMIGIFNSIAYNSLSLWEKFANAVNSCDKLYLTGFILVVFYMLMGIDDFIWDIASIWGRLRYRPAKLELHKLDSVPPKLLAVIIAAWREDNVLGDVIDNVLASVHYPKSMYHIFLGVYPNDTPTVAVAKALSERYPNVHVVANCLPGPTSKAQNINYVITQIKKFEKKHNWRFASFTIHDSEDVVHPYELKATNYMIDRYPALQFPVFPIVRMPRTNNFFRNITTGTYADEFAENHFTTMVNRRNAGAFVPSAGTGFALSRETLDSFGDGDVLPKDSLTEDYRLSLTLYEKGISMHYVLERVPRISHDSELVWDFIATRSMFPNTFKTAVKQKTRWILGITMQSFRFSDIFKTKNMRFSGRYSLYKDFKAKIGNLLAMVGYPVLVYFFMSLLMTLKPIYPVFSPSWYLSLVVTGMMIERQLFRSIAIYNVYGMRSVFFACLFPPGLPIRLIWGNVINLVATLKAYRQFIFGNQTPVQKEKQMQGEALKAVKKTFPRACKYCRLGTPLMRLPGVSCAKKGVMDPDLNCRYFKYDLDKCVAEEEEPVEVQAKPTLVVVGTPAPGSDSAGDCENGEGGENSEDGKKKLAWDKTDHTFLEKDVLKRYHRNLGDVLLEKGIVTPEELKDSLHKAANENRTIGSYLQQKHIITQKQLLTALSSVKHIQFLETLNFEYYNLRQFAGYFDETLLREMLSLPLLRTDTGYLMSFCDDSPQDAQTIIRNRYNITINAVFTSRDTILSGLAIIFGSVSVRSILLDLYEKGFVSYEQVVIGSNYLASTGRPESEVLNYMGLLPQYTDAVRDGTVTGEVAAHRSAFMKYAAM